MKDELIDFEADNHEELIEDFIDNHKGEYEDFIYIRFKEYMIDSKDDARNYIEERK